jgi:multidrug resistance efflux pump
LTLELEEAQKTIASQKQTFEEQQARIKELEEKLAAAQRAEEPTTNQAERMLRPQVITRKTQRCNKTDAGARKHAVLGSILATLRQRKLPVLGFLEQLQSPIASPPVIPSDPT